MKDHLERQVGIVHFVGYEVLKGPIVLSELYSRLDALESATDIDRFAIVSGSEITHLMPVGSNENYFNNNYWILIKRKRKE